MGSGASSASSVTSLKDKPVMAEWFEPDSEQAIAWQEKETGFGTARVKSFRDGVTAGSYANRIGNEKGELAGKLILYTRSKRWTNYSFFPDEPRIVMRKNVKLFAKLFLAVPLGRMLIGENVLPRARHKPKVGRAYTGEGDVLLALTPRVMALFVEVNGSGVPLEEFCQASAKMADLVYQDDVENPDLITSAIPESFVTYFLSRDQDQYFFVHYPLVAKHGDCCLETGEHGVTVSRCFQRLLGSLSGGQHKVKLKVQLYYDHFDYNYFPLDKNINALGLWHEGLKNEYLAQPHPTPALLQTRTCPLAEASFTVVVPHDFKELTTGWMEARPPKDRYIGRDMENIRKEAKTLARDSYAFIYGYSGFPDACVLTLSDKTERMLREQMSGLKYQYKYVEFAALWLSSKDTSKEAHGLLFELNMGLGEIQPGVTVNKWTLIPRQRGGKPAEVRPRPVRNMYIQACVQQIRKRVASMEEF